MLSVIVLAWTSSSSSRTSSSTTRRTLAPITGFGILKTFARHGEWCCGIESKSYMNEAMSKEREG